jgi:triacylglycerol lipase
MVQSRLADSGVTNSDFVWFDERGTDTQGIGCALPDCLVICFRGTESIRDILVDLRKKRVPFLVDGHPCGRVHEGFHEAFESVWENVKQFIEKQKIGVSRKVWLTGHSLGGALATLCAAKIAHLYKGTVAGLYTFGQPRVGDRIFRKDTVEKIGRDNIFRIYRSADPVAMLPRIGYKHVSGRRCYISRSGEFHFNAPWRTRAVERSITWSLIIPKLVTSGGRLSTLRGLVADHFSQGYLARLRDTSESNAEDRRRR